MSLSEDVVVYHEAGHVLACLIYAIPIDHVKLDYGLLGSLVGGHVELSSEQGINPRHNLIMTLMGAAAEGAWHQHQGHGWHFDQDASGHDLAMAQELMRQHNLRERAAWNQADLLVARSWTRIEALAETLRERRRLAQAAARRASKV